jgi:hypothetical protein
MLLSTEYTHWGIHFLVHVTLSIGAWEKVCLGIRFNERLSVK